MQSITLKSIALFFLIVAVVFGVAGFLDQHGGFWSPHPLIGDFYANIAAELASIAITVLVIDTLSERRVTASEKQKLIFQMGSPVNAVSREAIRELRARGWLQDGSMTGATLSYANLRDANIREADLREVDFTGALLVGAQLQRSNLQGARGLGDIQFVQMRYLQGATMPDGSRYDGRYRLPAENRWIKSRTDIDVANAEEMASFFRVPVEIYVSGQAWADNFLESIMLESKEEKQQHMYFTGLEPYREPQMLSSD